VKNEINGEPLGTFLDHYGRFACMMIDIDHFKRINDKYGHLMGDEVLKKIGELLNSNVIFRNNDIVGRYGGEEFVVILPETNEEHVKIPAHRLRYALNKITFIDEKGTKFNVSLSIGISEFYINDNSCEMVIDRADKALYYAKLHGRNQVVVYSEMKNTISNDRSANPS
jgi:diguanylate cyclase (GGDEF)-like protein